MNTVQSLSQLTLKHAQTDRLITSSIDFLRINHATQSTPLNRGVVKPSFCLILQGKKEIHIGTDVHIYGPGDYLIAAIDIPVAGRVAKASKALPYLGLSIELDAHELSALAREADLGFAEAKSSGPQAFVSSSNQAMLETCLQIVQLLEKGSQAKYLALLKKRELLYHLLTSPDGARFYQLVVPKIKVAGVHTAIAWLAKNFAQPLEVEHLAKISKMSVSSLHHKFKEATTMGPLQYQKRLRLQEARHLLLSGTTDISGAAYRVGYESHSHFTRDYHRLYGLAPSMDIKTLKMRTLDALQD